MTTHQPGSNDASGDEPKVPRTKDRTLSTRAKVPAGGTTKSTGGSTESAGSTEQAVGPYRPARKQFTPDTEGYRGGRSSDYRADYRAADYRANYRYGEAATVPESEGGIDWLSATWRYRFALLIPMLVGLALAAAFYTTRPAIFRSTARLLAETDTSWAPDSRRRQAGYVPPAELLMMQLRSEHVMTYATRHPLMAEALETMSVAELQEVLSNGVEFEDVLEKVRSERALPFFLHFDDHDPQFAVSAVTVLSDGMEDFFVAKNKTSVADLKKLITSAKDKLLPELNSLNSQFQAFRGQTELSWDQNQVMINPYREKQLALEQRRFLLEDELLDLSTKLEAISNTIEVTQDPLLVMEVVRQLLGEEILAVRKLVAAENVVTDAEPATRDEDLSLARLLIERELMPLEIERQQFASQFGSGHPSVRDLEQEIVATREKLNEVTALETQRLTELRIESESPSGELMKGRRDRAETAVSGFVRALETRRNVLESQIEFIDQQIATLVGEAKKLALDEAEHQSFLRRIGRAQKLHDGVEEQMTRINLSDNSAAVHVVRLNSPSAPELVAPILVKYLVAGVMLGGFAGLGLVYLLESQSKSFRSSEEIAAALKIPVMSHIPTDNHKLPRMAKGDVYPYHNIDPAFSSIHRPRSATAEAVRRLRTSLFFDATKLGAKVIQITSSLPEDGKTTLTANLAVSIARSGKTVALIDADLRRPQMTKSFGFEGKEGLSELLNRSCDPSQVIYPTPVKNLSFVPSGAIPSNASEALSSDQFSEFLRWTAERYDYVLIDTPPLLSVTDPAIVASVADAVVFTFRIRRGCRDQTKESLTILRNTGGLVLGCVINRIDHRTTATGYKGYQSTTYFRRRYATAPVATSKETSEPTA